MPKKVRSARGEMVDFDLLRIKQQMANAPKTVEVAARINFVESRLRRKIVRTAAQKVSEVSVDPKDITSTEKTGEIIGVSQEEQTEDQSDHDQSHRVTMKRKK